MFCITCLVLLIPGCMPARHIAEDEHLLTRNRLSVEDADIDPHELRSYFRQQPNRRILGFYRFHLNAWLFADRGKETRFRRWIKNTIGEAPVLFDASLSEQTSRQFELFLHNKGYFNAQVDYATTFRGKRAIVNYRLHGGKPYRVRHITYDIRDAHLKSFVFADTMNTLIREGQRYDADLLQKERQRLTRSMKEEGFFNFSRDYIFFRVDSTLNQQKVDIEVLINEPLPHRSLRDSQDKPASHRRYLINQVYVFPDYSRLVSRQHFADTTLYPAGEDAAHAYTFLHNGPMSIRPRTIAGNIMLEPGTYYSLSQLEKTHYYLAGLRNFRFVNMQFHESQQESLALNDTLGALDVRIELTRSPANAFTIEAEGLNTAGNLGIASNFVFQNRNIFGGAERLSLRFKGALEVSGESADQDVFQRLPFNTLELGTDVSLDIPKLVLPFRMERLSQTARPQTNIQAGVNYRQRPDYTRYILNVSYGFQWNPDNRRQHQFTPLEISSIKIFNDSILQANIPDANPLILSRYRDHLIGGMRYSYTYSSQQVDRKANFLYFRSNWELAGNTMYLLAKQFQFSRNEDGNYSIGDIPFAQYFKVDADIRFYRHLDNRSMLVYRLMGGVGLPYGNMEVMPFIKSYFGGGANSVRAWSIYNLGPGGYREPDALRFDKYGDIKLEANVEYRFPIYRYWHGALFLDAGNVWFLKENEQFPKGEFVIDRFHKELAIGAGAGIRLDFDFFLVRLDAAFPVRNPAMASGQRWVDGWPGLKQWNFNLGIGYPF